MKVHHWIDKYNYSTTQKIITKYYSSHQNGRFYCLNFNFWGLYLLRLFLVFCSFITGKKSTFTELFRTISATGSVYYYPDKHPLFNLKIKEFTASLFGFRYHVPKTIIPMKGIEDILRSNIFFTAQPSPTVSIIIPVYNDLANTYNCLSALQTHTPVGVPVEIIIIDDFSEDTTASFFQKNVSGVVYIRNDRQKGKLQSTKIGLHHAKAELVCVLSNHIQVSSGWLEPLVKTMKNCDVGAVGCKIIYKNGLLKQAGGLAYADGNFINYGEFQDAAHPSFNYVRQVDYASVLLSRKSLLENAGLFNNNFGALEDYQNLNLCLTISKHKGKKIIYQPLSQVVEMDNPDLMAANMEESPDSEISKIVFLDAWGKILSSHLNSGNINSDARKYQTGKTILFIDDVVLAPDQDSGSNRLFKIMALVKSLGYHVIFVPNDGKKRGKYFDQMIFNGFEVLYSFPNRKAMIKSLTKILPYIDVAWLCKPHNNEYFKFIFDLKKDCFWIYDTIDLHFLRLSREGKLSGNPAVLKLAASIKDTELSIAQKADITIAITPDEKLVLNNEGIRDVIVIPNIHEQEFSRDEEVVFDQRTGLLFIGGYIHSPNVDAAKWLANQIMPEVWKTDPTIRLTLLGSNPSEEVLALQSDRIDVPGYIHDVSSYFNHSRVFVAPLRFGAGMKGKIGQSLEFGLPIVSTSIGVEGMNLSNGENVMIANTTEDFVQKILHLYNSPILWGTIRKNSFQAIQDYSPESVTLKLEKLFQSLNK